MLREFSGSTEETENMMTRALQVITVHCQLRAATDMDDLVIDEVEADISIAFSFVCDLHRKILYVGKKIKHQ